MLADDEKWFRVSLRFAGDSLPVDALESRLGIRPSSIGRKGEHIDGNQARAKFQTNVWTFCVDTNSSIPFEKQMDPLVNMLESKREALFELLTLPQIEADLLLGFSSGNRQGGASLSNTLLGRIAKLGLSISLDLYPPNCDEH